MEELNVELTDWTAPGESSEVRTEQCMRTTSVEASEMMDREMIGTPVPADPASLYFPCTDVDSVARVALE